MFRCHVPAPLRSDHITHRATSRIRVPSARTSLTLYSRLRVVYKLMYIDSLYATESTQVLTRISSRGLVCAARSRLSTLVSRLSRPEFGPRRRESLH